MVGGLDVWALCPRLAGTAVGGHDDLQLLTQCGDQDESGGVVLRRGLARPGSARAAGGGCTWGRHGVDVARALIGGEIHPDILSELSLRRIWL